MLTKDEEIVILNTLLKLIAHLEVIPPSIKEYEKEIKKIIEKLEEKK